MPRGLELPTILHAGLEARRAIRIVVWWQLKIALLPQNAARADDAHAVAQLIRATPDEAHGTGQESRLARGHDDRHGRNCSGPEWSIGRFPGLSSQRVSDPSEECLRVFTPGLL